MSTLSQFTGGGATTSIVNAHSAGGTKSGSIVEAQDNNGAREVLSGALTANTLATLLTVTGSGRVPQLSAYTKDTTARTVRLVVEVDGVSVFDATSSSITVAGIGIFAAGFNGAGNFNLWPGEPIVFSSSLVVKVASSLTETNKVAIAYSVNRT